jgi:hypothetical protein
VRVLTLLFYAVALGAIAFAVMIGRTPAPVFPLGYITFVLMLVAPLVFTLAALALQVDATWPAQPRPWGPARVFGVVVTGVLTLLSGLIVAAIYLAVTGIAELGRVSP